MKIKKILVALAFTALASTSVYSSTPIQVSTNGAPFVPLSTNPINDTFIGAARIYSGICSLNCTLSVNATLVDVPSGNIALMVVNGASFSGSLLCGIASFDSPAFPWAEPVSHSVIGTFPPLNLPFSKSTIDIGGCLPCIGMDLDLTFSDANGGFIDFQGTHATAPCGIESSGLYSANYYTLIH